MCLSPQGWPDYSRFTVGSQTRPQRPAPVCLFTFGSEPLESRKCQWEPAVASTSRLSLALTIVLAASCATAPEPEAPLTLSYDGLVPVSREGPTRVWIREGFPLAGYRSIMLQRLELRFRPLPLASSPSGAAAPGAPPDAARKAELASLIREEFSTALERLELTQVAEPGPGVLLVRGAILDVVTRPRSGSSDSGLDFIGQPTFMVELVDASSDSVLARAVDTRAARAPTGRRAAGEADATRALLARWAALLVDALNDLTVIDQYQETRTDA
jgi:hypothetical protein